MRRNGRFLIQSAEDIADQITTDSQARPQARSHRQHQQHRHRPYQQNQSLYSGSRTSMLDSGDELEGDENASPDPQDRFRTPVTRNTTSDSVESGYGTPLTPLFPMQQHSNSTPARPGLGSGSILALLQKQQHLLQQVVSTQKEMQTKQSEFEAKLNEIAAKSTSSSNDSRASDRGRKMRISRDLTVSALMV